MPSLGDYSQLIIAITVVINCFLSWRNARHAEKITEGIHDIKQDVTAVKENVTTIEIATNSMKDALVLATAKASHLEGRAEIIAEQKEDKEI